MNVLAAAVIQFLESEQGIAAVRGALEGKADQREEDRQA